MSGDAPKCAGCGLLIGDSLFSVDGRAYHRSCALDVPESAEEAEQRRYRALLKRLAHWGNSLGWGQGT